MTGVRPQRIPSPRKDTTNINYDDIEKNFVDILEKNSRIEHLRNECLNIFKQNGIKIDLPPPEEKKEEEKSVLITQEKIGDKTDVPTISELTSKAEENANRWKELKNKEKSFNIRGVVRRSESQRKTGGLRDGSLNKIQ